MLRTVAVSLLAALALGACSGGGSTPEERVRAVVNHIVNHYQTKVEPNGFKAQVVAFDRECCVLYKEVMDELIGPEASAIVMSTAPGDPISPLGPG